MVAGNVNYQLEHDVETRCGWLVGRMVGCEWGQEIRDEKLQMCTDSSYIVYKWVELIISVLCMWKLSLVPSSYFVRHLITATGLYQWLSKVHMYYVHIYISVIKVHMYYVCIYIYQWLRYTCTMCIYIYITVIKVHMYYVYIYQWLRYTCTMYIYIYQWLSKVHMYYVCIYIYISD